MRLKVKQHQGHCYYTLVYLAGAGDTPTLGAAPTAETAPSTTFSDNPPASSTPYTPAEATPSQLQAEPSSNPTTPYGSESAPTYNGLQTVTPPVAEQPPRAPVKATPTITAPAEAPPTLTPPEVTPTFLTPAVEPPPASARRQETVPQAPTEAAPVAAATPPPQVNPGMQAQALYVFPVVLLPKAFQPAIQARLWYFKLK